MLWFDLQELANQANSRQIQLALYPTPTFQIQAADWWSDAVRDDAWWDVWFDEYRSFSLHHAQFAQQAGLPAIVLGGGWLSPALPGGLLADGSEAAAPVDAESRWRDLLADIRASFSGQILWAMPAEQADQAPVFLDLVDGIYLEFSFPIGARAALAEQGSSLEAQLADWLDNHVALLQTNTGKAVILAASYPSDSDLTDQYQAYLTLLQAVNQRAWISGFISQEYYPPAALLDRSGSVNGKPTSELLAYWFAGFLGITPP